MLKRIFIAVNLPEETKKELSFYQEEMKEYLRGVRWVEKENMHITMAFIGSVREEKMFSLINELEMIQEDPFKVKLKEMCYIPSNRRNAKMIWARGKSKEISSLNKRLEKRISSAGINYNSEEREFVPHVTLGRIRSWEWKRIPLAEIPLLEEGIEINFPVNSFELMESKLKKGGAVYEEIKKFKLRN